MAIIDAHAYLGRWPTPVAALDADELELLMKQFGITRCCVASSAAVMGDLAAGNRAVAEAIEGRPALLGYCVINPNFLDLSTEEATRCLRQPNFVGVKIHAAYDRQPFDSLATRELLKRLMRYDRPILLEPETIEDLEAVQRVAAEYPTEKFVIVGMMRDAWQEAVQLAAGRTNVVFLCGGAHAERDAVKHASEAIGPHRVIFGSGAPLAHPVYALGMVRDADLSAGLKDRILQGAACRLFGIRP